MAATASSPVATALLAGESAMKKARGDDVPTDYEMCGGRPVSTGGVPLSAGPAPGSSALPPPPAAGLSNEAHAMVMAIQMSLRPQFDGLTSKIDHVSLEQTTMDLNIDANTHTGCTPSTLG
eukprot:5874559-Pyramimonas_sp.AAC.1